MMTSLNKNLTKIVMPIILALFIFTSIISLASTGSKPVQSNPQVSYAQSQVLSR